MHSFLPLSLLLFLTSIDTSVHAVSFPFRVRTLTGSSKPVRARGFGRRAGLSGSSSDNVTIPVANTHNSQYISNLTLGGTTIAVMLDTGSSDLWVNFPSTVPSTTDLGKSLTLSYAVGEAAGDIHTAQLQFDEYTVDDQAFLLVTNASSFSTDIHAQGFDGLVGLGPNEGSNIFKKMKSSVGDTMLNNIFQQNKTTQNFISFLLDRQGDPGDPFTGQLTISELVTGYENITSMPELDVETVHKLLKADQHWSVLTDKNKGIIGPDGAVIDYDSIVPNAPDGQLVAVVDSGFTFPQVPRDVSDAIYGRVQGAVYDSSNEFWTLPCGQLLTLSFNFGGINYPVHPLDVVNDDFDYVDSLGNAKCIGAFQPITSAFSLLGEYDLILGMGFLRNTYTLLDYGNWIDESSTDRGDPFVQFLSVTDNSSSIQDFIQVRLNGVDTTSDSQWALLPADQMQHSPVSSEEKKKEYEETVLSRWPYILMGCLIFVLLIVGLCVWRCCCRRGAKKAKGGKKKGFFAGKAAPSSYVALQDQGLGGQTASTTNQTHHGDYGSGGYGYNGAHA